MKTCQVNKFLMIILAIITGLGVTSCNNEDINKEEDKVKYEAVLKQIITSDGRHRFPECKGRIIRYLACESEDVAKGIVSALTLGNINGGETSTLNLHEYGKIEVIECNNPQNEFFLVSVNLKGIDSFQLHLVSIPYLLDLFPSENGDDDDLLLMDTSTNALNVASATCIYQKNARIAELQ